MNTTHARNRTLLGLPLGLGPWLWLILGLAAVGWLACRGDAKPAAAAPVRSAGALAATAAVEAGTDAPRPPGNWRTARAAELSAASEASASLQALPYLQGYRSARASDRGVTIWDRARAYPGLDLYTSGHAAEAVLIDLAGREIHRWRRGLTEVWPRLAGQPTTARLEYYRRARLLPDGDLLAIFEGTGLIRLDRDSNLRWRWRSGAHHDLDLDRDGRIWVLDRSPALVPEIDPSQPVLEDFVAVLTPDGRLLRRISILRALQHSPWAPLIARLPRKSADILHPNTIELLDGRLAARLPAFRAGNVLLSICQADTVAVLDPDREVLVWAMTGPFRLQHQPTVLANGNLMIFDNLGARTASRVLEIDPQSGRIAWQYGGRPEDDFFSKTLGTAQRLANGDTLITESENGRAFEVTAQGEIVWEYRSPQRAGEHRELVASLFEMLRVAPAEVPVEWRGTVTAP